MQKIKPTVRKRETEKKSEEIFRPVKHYKS